MARKPKHPVELFRGHPPKFPLINGSYNRRFMYHPKTGEFIFGGGDIANSSHAHEHGESGATGEFDDFVRGWIGFGGSYRNGIIHFAPGYKSTEIEDPRAFNDLFDTLEVFLANGATKKTILRSAGTEKWEEPFGEAYPELFQRKSAAESFVRRLLATSLIS